MRAALKQLTESTRAVCRVYGVKIYKTVRNLKLPKLHPHKNITHTPKETKQPLLLLKELRNSFCYIKSNFNLTSKDIVAPQLTRGAAEASHIETTSGALT